MSLDKYGTYQPDSWSLLGLHKWDRKSYTGFMNTNFIKKAVENTSRKQVAEACGVSVRAVRKWEDAGRLPRTEWTGETDYGYRIEELTSSLSKSKRVTRSQLVPKPSKTAA